MTIFTVIVTRETVPGALEERLKRDLPNDHIPVAPNVWLIAARGPVQEVSNSLGISDGSVANGIIAAMGSYFGRAPTNVWDWIKAKWEETASGE